MTTTTPALIVRLDGRYPLKFLELGSGRRAYEVVNTQEATQFASYLPAWRMAREHGLTLSRITIQPKTP